MSWDSSVSPSWQCWQQWYVGIRWVQAPPTAVSPLHTRCALILSLSPGLLRFIRNKHCNTQHRRTYMQIQVVPDFGTIFSTFLAPLVYFTCTWAMYSFFLYLPLLAKQLKQIKNNQILLEYFNLHCIMESTSCIV